MRYVNAAHAARMLGIGDKTIRRWLKEGKKLPGAIVRANGEYAIPENEVEELKQLRSKFAIPQGENLTSHDQTDVSVLAEKLAALEQEVAELRKGQSLPSQQDDKPPVSPQPIANISQPASPQKRNVEPKRTYKPRDTALPDGCILAIDFARNHDVKRETFRDHMINGLGPGLIGTSTDTIPERDHVAHETRPKPGREKETERYLTSDQQRAALEFWERHDVDYSQCNDIACWCHTLKQENE